MTQPSKAHTEMFNAAIGKLQQMPEFKVYLDELRGLRACLGRERPRTAAVPSQDGKRVRGGQRLGRMVAGCA